MSRPLLLAAFVLVSGCLDTPADPTLRDEEADGVSENFFGVTNPYVRAAPAGGVSAIYFEIENRTATPDTLVSATTDVSDDVRIHQTTVGEDGLRRMEPVDQIPVPSGATVALEPGGYHVMLLDLKRDLAEGDSLLVELTFADRGTLTPRVPVRAVGSGEDR